jgi:glycosyltransferase involved in cell wall biosynthesis
MEKPELSIAMCTYNGSRFLGEQLDSIAVQSRLPDELVVCDDGSTDETVEILERFARRAPFVVRLEINPKNLGSTKNFEKAISLCRGEIIALADQDDVWYPNKLDLMQSTFLGRPSVGVVFSDADVIDENQVSLGFRLWTSAGFTPVWQKDVSSGLGTRVLLNRNVVTGATMAFLSKLRNLVLPIPENWVHDGWIALLVSVFADLALIREPLIRYRKHAGQQIGPAAYTLSERLARARRTGAEQYCTLAQQFMLAHDRLSISGDDSRVQAVLPQLEMKIKHLNTRAQMATHGVSRLPRVLEELLLRHYHRYSDGWKSAAKDLWKGGD